jgi:hypothetical protein
MQTTLRLNKDLYRQAKAEAVRIGVTLTAFIEDALAAKLKYSIESELEEKKRLQQERNFEFDRLLKKTSSFAIGKKPTRDEMNERR